MHTNDPIRVNLRPGKFENELVISEYVYNLSLEGADDIIVVEGMYTMSLLEGNLKPCATARLDMDMTDDEVYFLTDSAGAIVVERDNGFVDVEYFDTHAELMDVWNGLLQDHEQNGDDDVWSEGESV